MDLSLSDGDAVQLGEVAKKNDSIISVPTPGIAYKYINLYSTTSIRQWMGRMEASGRIHSLQQTTKRKLRIHQTFDLRL